IEPSPFPLTRFLRERIMLRLRVAYGWVANRAPGETATDRRVCGVDDRGGTHRFLFLAGYLLRSPSKSPRGDSEGGREWPRKRTIQENWTSRPRHPWPWPRDPISRKR